jgi:hypothetical protein
LAIYLLAFPWLASPPAFVVRVALRYDTAFVGKPDIIGGTV